MVNDRISALKEAIDGTLSAIAEGRNQVQVIAESTLNEVQLLEAQFEAVREECAEAIQRVEEVERLSREARERLMIVNRNTSQSSEMEMKRAYDRAQQLQIELGQWREREAQLRVRRDDIARRLKALRAMAHHAEILTRKLDNAAVYLNGEFQDVASVLETAQLNSSLGLQMIQMQEEERRWLSERLHDGPMQSLATTAMRMQTAWPSAVDNVQQKDVRDRLNLVISDLRQVVFDLRPPLLDDLGLVPTLKRYVQQWADGALVLTRIHLVGLEAVLSSTEKVVVFRGIQEALNNIRRHANATEVDITLTYGTDKLTVQIADNGQGIPEINWTKWVEEGSLGLSISRQRLSLLGGGLEVESSERNGTSVVISLPVTRRDD